MKPTDFIMYEIKGKFLDVIRKAQFLRENGINVNVDNGKVSIGNANDYMKALLLLRKYNLVDKEEKKVWMQELYDKLKYRRTVNKDYRCLNQGSNRVIMYRENGDYFSIIKQRNKESGKLEYIVMAKNSDPDSITMEKHVSRRMSSYYISEDNPLFDMATRYCQRKKVFGVEDNSPVSFYPAANGYFLNFVDCNPVSCYPGTCILKFSDNSSMIASMFETLQSQNLRKEQQAENKVYKMVKSVA